MSKNIYRFSLIFLLALVVLSACSLPSRKSRLKEKVATNNQISETATSTSKTRTNKIKKFANQTELATFLQASQGLLDQTEVEPGDLALEVKFIASQTGGLVKDSLQQTDGQYLYLIEENFLKVFSLKTAELVSELKLNKTPQGLIISGSQAIIYGADESLSSAQMAANLSATDKYTFLQVYDLSRITNPNLGSDLIFEGQLADLSLSGNYLNISIASAVSPARGQTITPQVFSQGTLLDSECSTKTTACYLPEVYYFDIDYHSFKYLQTTTLDLNNQSVPLTGQAYLMSGEQNYYLTDKNIYLTYTEKSETEGLLLALKQELFLAQLSSADQQKAEEIKVVADYILTQDEKEFKLDKLIDEYLNKLTETERQVEQARLAEAWQERLKQAAIKSEKTIIHKFGLTANQAVYRGMGEVNGQLISGLTLNEADSYLRVVTSNQAKNLSEGKYSSNIYVLNNELKLVGKLENITTEGQITAAHFSNERAYLGTFKANESLYVINLADPLQPAVLGAIKVPEYAQYLYALDREASKFIGIGQERANDNGRLVVKNLKLSLFDFTNIKEPKVLDYYNIGDRSSQSAVMTDQQAFFYSSDKNIISFPVTLYDNGDLNFDGFLFFTINNAKLALQGNVDHRLPETVTLAATSQSSLDLIRRTWLTSTNLYTLSSRYLKVNDANDLELLSSSPLVDLIEVITEEAEEELEPAIDNDREDLGQPEFSEEEEAAPQEIETPESQEADLVIEPELEAPPNPEPEAPEVIETAD